MKTPRFLTLLLAALLATLAPRPAQANVEVSFDFFYDSLSPYGEWIEIADYGTAWRPTDVDRDWAPYADGYWAYTDAGWTWVSYEEFGGIVYHYGRWVFAEGEGWCWVPEYEWGPAWVSWRQSDDHVGWAPLPPEARWEPTVGLSIWVDRQYDIGPGYYNFCRVRDFGAPVLRPVIVNRIENVTIIRRTVNCTNITYNTHYGDRRVIYNGGLNYDAINRRSDRRVPALKLVQNLEVNLPGSRDWDGDRDRRDRDGRRRNFNGQVSGNQLVVTAPVVRRRSDTDSFKPKVSKVIAADRVSRGWNGVKNDEVRRELRQEMQRQTKGLTPQTAPARPVAVADLKAVPEKADPQAPSPVATRDQRDRPDRRDRGPEEGTADQSTRERGREQSPGETQRPVAGEPGLKPSNPNTDAGKRSQPEGPPAVTAPNGDPRVARPGEGSGPVRDGDRRGEAMRQQNEGAAQQQKAQAEQEATRRKQAEAAAEKQRAAEMERNTKAQRQQQEAEREKMQAEQKKAARQQAEAAPRQKQMDAQRDEEGKRQRQREEAAAAQQKQMDARQRAQEAGRAQEERARQQQEQQAAEKQQKRQHEQNEANERSRREQEGPREQMRQQQKQQQQPVDAPRQQGDGQSGKDEERRGKGKDRND